MSADDRWLLLMMMADDLFDLLFVVLLSSFVLFSQRPKCVLGFSVQLHHSRVFSLHCSRALVSRTIYPLTCFAGFEDDQLEFMPTERATHSRLPKARKMPTFLFQALVSSAFCLCVLPIA